MLAQSSGVIDCCENMFGKNSLDLSVHYSKKGLWVPPSSGGYPGSMETKRCFLLCLQVSSSSSLLLSVVRGFAISIVNFSLKHKSQALLPEEKTCPFALIDHFISKLMPLSFSPQIYEESVV